MSFDWIDKVDGQDDVLAEDVNSIAHAVIKNQESINKKQNELTFDNTPTLGSTNPVTSNGIYNFVKENASGGSASIVVDSELSSTSENPVQNKVITKELNNKQDKLTFDNEPKLGSSNPITSDGVFNALKDIEVSGGSDIDNNYIINMEISWGDNEFIIKTVNDNYSDLEEAYNAGKNLIVRAYFTEAEIYFNTLLEQEEYGFIFSFDYGNLKVTLICSSDSWEIYTSNIVDSELSEKSRNPVQNKVIASELNKKVNKINGMGLARIGSYGTSYYIAYQACDDGKAMNIEVYDTDQTDTAISKAIGDVNTALDNIIAIQNELIGGDSV